MKTLNHTILIAVSVVTMLMIVAVKPPVAIAKPAGHAYGRVVQGGCEGGERLRGTLSLVIFQ
ncbi:MAG: hypothetical protein ACRDG4_11235 [Chloroflexota bacterium]